MSELSFLNPGYFWLIAVIFILAIYFYVKRKKRSAIFSPVFSRLIKYSKKNKYLKSFKIIRYILIFIILVLMVFILARPRVGFEEDDISKSGIDIVVALDVSESMLADDLKPNRIDAAKNVIVDFIGQLYSDRVSVVVFAGKPFTQSPLTFDYGILTQYIEEISTKSISQGVRGLSGTAVGDAILSGIYKLEAGAGGEDDEDNQEQEDRSKVIILLTDGDANTGVDPTIAAKMAADKDIKVYTIGIGQVIGYPMSYIDQFGRKQFYRDRSGNVVKTYLNEDNLKKIAEISGGKYFAATDNDAFKQIFKEIDQLEKKEIKVSKVKRYKENFEDYAWYLFITVFIFAMMEYLKPKLS